MAIGAFPLSYSDISGDDSGAVIMVSVVEAGHAVDTPVMLELLTVTSVAESGHAVDTPNRVLILHASVNEFGHAVDAIHLPPGHVFVAEFGHAADTSTRTLILTASVTEAGHAVDVTRRAPPPAVVEVGHAVDMVNVAVNHVWKMRVHETGAATDTPSGTAIHHARVREAGILHDIVSEGVNGHFNVSVIESSAAWDTVSNLHILRPFVNEFGHASDGYGVNRGGAGHFVMSVVETGHAVDTVVDPEIFSCPGVFFWGYSYLYNQGFTEAAVWCAGLDCGNHPIDPDAGFVFVPWQSDPDGLFTPNYLVEVNDNPPLSGGFGPSACNIDIVNNAGGVTRVVVDLAIGLPYTSQLQVLRPNSPEQTHSQFGPSLGLTRRLSRYAVQLQNSGATMTFGTNTNNQLPVNYTQPNGEPYLYSQMFSGVYRDFIDDDYSYDGMLMMEIERPYPAMIVALASIFTTIDLE